MNPIKDLLASKRFIVTALATASLTTLAALGKIPVSQLGSSIVWLAGALTAAYGIENAAAAHGASFPDPPAPASASASATNVTPAETPAAKAAQP